MIKIDDYMIYQQHNKIIIHLPQTNETLDNTVEPISKRKVFASDDDLIKLLTTTIGLMEERNDT